MPEIAEVVSGRKNFKTAAKSVGKQTQRKQLVEGEGSRRAVGSSSVRHGSRKRTASRIIPTESTKQSSRSRRDISHYISSHYKHFSLNMSNNNFRYQPFVAVSGNLGGKVPIVEDVPSSHEQEIYPTTSLDENCIEFKFRKDLNFYVDLSQFFLAMKLKFVKERGYDTYESKEKKREHKD